MKFGDLFLTHRHSWSSCLAPAPEAGALYQPMPIATQRFISP
jgi:hypothetical protein